MNFPQQTLPKEPDQTASPAPAWAAALPDPEKQPLMTIEEAGRRAYGLARAASYAAASRGELPVIRQGRRKLVPTALLRRKLGLDGGEGRDSAA